MRFCLPTLRILSTYEAFLQRGYLGIRRPRTFGRCKPLHNSRSHNAFRTQLPAQRRVLSPSTQQSPESSAERGIIESVEEWVDRWIDVPQPEGEQIDMVGEPRAPIDVDEGFDGEDDEVGDPAKGESDHDRCKVDGRLPVTDHLVFVLEGCRSLSVATIGWIRWRNLSNKRRAQIVGGLYSMEWGWLGVGLSKGGSGWGEMCGQREEDLVWMCEGWYEGLHAKWTVFRDMWRDFISGGTSTLAERGRNRRFKNKWWRSSYYFWFTVGFIASIKTKSPHPIL